MLHPILSHHKIKEALGPMLQGNPQLSFPKQAKFQCIVYVDIMQLITKHKQIPNKWRQTNCLRLSNNSDTNSVRNASLWKRESYTRKDTISIQTIFDKKLWVRHRHREIFLLLWCPKIEINVFSERKPGHTFLTWNEKCQALRSSQKVFPLSLTVLIKRSSVLGLKS